MFLSSSFPVFMVFRCMNGIDRALANSCIACSFCAKHHCTQADLATQQNSNVCCRYARVSWSCAGFLEVDKALGSSRIDCEFSGSTSVVSFLKGKTLTTAWVGDSRGVMGRTKKGGGYEAVPLTKDHKPTAPEEKARIVATNGRVER